jgi:hypothetical protein
MAKAKQPNPDCRNGAVPCKKSGGWQCKKWCRCRGTGRVLCPTCNGRGCR